MNSPQPVTQSSPSRVRNGPALFRAMLFGLVVCGPLVVGIPQGFESWPQALIFGAILGFSAGLLTILSASSWEGAHRIVWVVVSVCLSVTVLDVALRPLRLPIVVEPDRFYAWPPMPLVNRFAPNLRYRGTTYDALAAEAGMLSQAPVREYTFIVDRYGFRNERLPQRPLDVITIGDSLTAGHGTTQDRVWPAVLSKRYGLAVYNLGVSGDGPWHDYANLLMEVDRLPLKDRGTVVVWNLYNGAVLRTCEGIFDRQELPWRTGRGTFKTFFKNFRVRSPLGQLLPRLWSRAMARGGQQNPNTRDIIVRQFPNGTPSLFVSWDHVESYRTIESFRNHPDYGCVRQTIAAAKKLAQSKHLALVVLAAPTKDEVYPWLVEGRAPWSSPPRSSGVTLGVAEICKEEHIPFLDLTPPLLAAARRVYQESGGQVYWPYDNHWNVEGNEEVARIVHQVYTSVLRSGGLPPD